MGGGAEVGPRWYHEVQEAMAQSSKEERTENLFSPDYLWNHLDQDVARL